MTMTKTELLAEFQRALDSPTSGSLGARVLKILYEQMPEMQYSEMFKDTEAITIELMEHDHYAYFVNMLRGRFEILVADFERDQQRRADEARERMWEQDDQNEGIGLERWEST